jgi:carbon-monoxide dehydrogenase large subunit
MPIGPVARSSRWVCPSAVCRAQALSSFPDGCHVCELEIDPDIGSVAIDRYTVVDDRHRYQPVIGEGADSGRIAQGAGQALLEEVVYDRDSGRLLTGTLLDYGIPRADMLPAISIDFSPVPSTTNPLGAKGAGEGGTVAAREPQRLPVVLNGEEIARFLEAVP